MFVTYPLITYGPPVPICGTEIDRSELVKFVGIPCRGILVFCPFSCFCGFFGIGEGWPVCTIPSGDRKMTIPLGRGWSTSLLSKRGLRAPEGGSAGFGRLLSGV